MKLNQLVTAIESVHKTMRDQAVQSVNTALTIRNWLTGHYLVEFEQKGEDRAKYGDRLMEILGDKLARRKLRGFSPTNLKHFRQLYLTYPQIRQTVSGEFKNRLIPYNASSSIEESNRRITKHGCLFTKK